MPREPSHPTTPVDVRLRVIALALEPALALAHASALPLDDVQALVATGYFRQARRRGLSLRAIAKRLRKSLRTVATLSKRASEAKPFMQLGDRITLRRKLAAYLAAHGPSSEAGLRAAMRDPRSNAELAQLCEEGIVQRTGDAYAVAAEQLSLVGDDLDRRLDSVRHFLEVVTHTLHGRFFRNHPDAEAFARVLSFSARHQALPTLRAKYYEALRNAVVAADHEAAGHGIDAAVAICFVETPKGRTWSP